MKLLRLAGAALAVALATLCSFMQEAQAAPKPAEVIKITPRGLFAQVGGSACQVASPGSPNWKGTQHGVCSTWTASTTPSVTYNIWRSTTTGGPYVQINTVPIANLFFLDSTAAVSTTYFYVATAVDASGDQSAYSNEASVTTPATFSQTPAAPTGNSAKTQ